MLHASCGTSSMLCDAFAGGMYCFRQHKRLCHGLLAQTTALMLLNKRIRQLGWNMCLQIHRVHHFAGTYFQHPVRSGIYLSLTLRFPNYPQHSPSSTHIPTCCPCYYLWMGKSTTLRCLLLSSIPNCGILLMFRAFPDIFRLISVKRNYPIYSAWLCSHQNAEVRQLMP